MRWTPVLFIVTALLSPAAASGDPAPSPRRATLRVLETSAMPAVVAVDSFRVEKRLDWARSERSLAYLGVQEAALSAKLHTDSAADEDRLFATLSLASDVDPHLARPPLVELTFGTRAYRGVLTSLVTECDGARCRAELTLRQAEQAVRSASDEHGLRDLGF